MLRLASYSSKGRMSRAVLSFYAAQSPLDWKFTDRPVIADNFFFTTDKPNLHHIFPTNYLANNPGANNLDHNSLMNIAYLTQITNLDISDRPPLEYIKDYDQNTNFEGVLHSHLIPKDILTWIRSDDMPDDALDQFIEARINMIIEKLSEKLEDIKIEIIVLEMTELKD